MFAVIGSLKGSLDIQEQGSRRNCLLIHGLPQSRNKNTNELVIDTITEKVGEEVKNDEIDQSHRLGVPKINGKSRAIIIKFGRCRCRYSRYRSLKNKKKLKGKGINVTESLTKSVKKPLQKLEMIMVLRMCGPGKGIFFIKM